MLQGLQKKTMRLNSASRKHADFYCFCQGLTFAIEPCFLLEPSQASCPLPMFLTRGFTLNPDTITEQTSLNPVMKHAVRLECTGFGHLVSFQFLKIGNVHVGRFWKPHPPDISVLAIFQKKKLRLEFSDKRFGRRKGSVGKDLEPFQSSSGLLRVGKFRAE